MISRTESANKESKQFRRGLHFVYQRNMEMEGIARTVEKMLELSSSILKDVMEKTERKYTEVFCKTGKAVGFTKSSSTMKNLLMWRRIIGSHSLSARSTFARNV